MAGTVRSLVLLAACTFAAATCAKGKMPPPPAPAVPVSHVAQELVLEVVSSMPHDRTAFTQGLLYAGGKLYESTGLEGRSTLRRVDPATGAVEKSIPIEPAIFAEGLALAGGELFQLSWMNGRAFVYRADTFERVREYTYPGQGWGLTYDNHRLIMSDGSARLTFRDPKTFQVTGGVEVLRGGVPVRNLNELEWVGGQVFANVWQTDLIVRIDPATGDVTGYLDAGGLLSPSERRGSDVLNGIAYVPERGNFYLTGKLWPKLFEVRITVP
jgi:glutamine cyclotransferase